LFRNTWSWSPDTPKPSLKPVSGQKGALAVAASHADLGEHYLYCEGDVPLLFTENETNNERLFGKPNASRYVKDGINNCVVRGGSKLGQPGENGDEVCCTLSVNCGNRKDGYYTFTAKRSCAGSHGRSKPARGVTC